MKYLVFVFVFINLLSCKDNATNSKTEYRLIKDQLNGLQSRIDSLIGVMKESEPLKGATPFPQNIKTKKSIKATKSYLTTPAKSSNPDYNWKSAENQTVPSYQLAKEKEAYKIRVGAICCDGSRSYATGRGACSHHGGVCKWLYQ
jgi:hypothetical protein